MIPPIVIQKNLSIHELVERSIKNYESQLTNDGALVVQTGKYTGRSANAKFIVKDELTQDTIDWGDVNKPITQTEFDEKYKNVKKFLGINYRNYGRDYFEQDVFVGAGKENQIPIRVITEFAWHSLFVRNMFITPTDDELKEFTPEYTIICVPSIEKESFIWLNLTEKLVLIGGTQYAGEIKKSVFTIMNYLLPAKNIMPMHCSVNTDNAGNSAIFFGLSGTGKTTLSADSSRHLVGDDEHGWGEDGLFNFEGGCYAKIIKLNAKAEPEIYDTCHMFGTILENVIVNDGVIDLDDNTLTENTRASYPLAFIPNIVSSGQTSHPKDILMLTCDAFGVLPPLSKLSVDEAIYYFLSGYTAKVAGTEQGLGEEPQATFSTCFGAPFMPRPPIIYAHILKEKIIQNNVNCWLVNTGWTGGGFGAGERISIQHTRRLVNAVLNSELDDNDFIKENTFGLSIPKTCNGIPAEILNPRGTWKKSRDYDQVAQQLIASFRENFEQYEIYMNSGFMNGSGFRL